MCHSWGRPSRGIGGVLYICIRIVQVYTLSIRGYMGVSHNHIWAWLGSVGIYVSQSVHNNPVRRPPDTIWVQHAGIVVDTLRITEFSKEPWTMGWGGIFSRGSSLYEPRFFCEGLASGDLIFRCIVGTSFFYVSYRVMCVCLMFSHFPDHVVVNMSTLHGLRNMCRVGGYHFMFRRELIFRGVADTARRPDGRADRWDKA